MEQFVIEGNIPLSGTITPAGNKNAALVGSSGHLEISVVNGNAAQTLGLGPDAPITLRKNAGGMTRSQLAS